MKIASHPWQKGPTELISYAIQHLHQNTDFGNRLAFLLLDVGVETLFKTYLALPDELINSSLKYHQRKEASEGNFHVLVAGIKNATKENLQPVNLTHVQFYHNLRNKLYHQGNGITVPPEQVKAYAELVVALLRNLLEVDLFDELFKPEREAKRQEKEEQEKLIIQEKFEQLKRSKEQLQQEILISVEVIEPLLLLPSFNKKFEELTDNICEENYFGIDDRGNYSFGFGITNDIEKIVIFNVELHTLLDNSITNDEIKKKIFAEDDLRVVYEKIDITKITAQVLLHPDLFNLLFSIMILSIPEASKWSSTIDEIDFFFALDKSPWKKEEDNYFENTLSEAEQILDIISNMIKNIQSWIDSKK